MEGVPSSRGYKVRTPPAQPVVCGAGAGGHQPRTLGRASLQGGFASRLMVKDLGLVLKAAQYCKAPTPLTEQAQK